MLKFLYASVACFVLAAPAAAQSRDWHYLIPEPSFGCLNLSADDQTACIQRQLAERLPCTGTVDERLSCLDRKAAKQADEIYALRRQLHERTSPRVSPLGSLD